MERDSKRWVEYFSTVTARLKCSQQNSWGMSARTYSSIDVSVSVCVHMWGCICTRTCVLRGYVFISTLTAPIASLV